MTNALGLTRQSNLNSLIRGAEPTQAFPESVAVKVM